ncbi:MAG: T9SS type A sorting domain-containing protein [Dysgonamonadaceae bacterium]|jgi:hypothetical protein|nr:T9SS type A sorting domain-containing protein [Dysgonamonadaceae bacterium]
MKKHILLLVLLGITFSLQAQQIIPAGGGSYASYPPAAVENEDGYFANPYQWFKNAWPSLNLHDNARNKPLPTNDWWTEFLFRGLGRDEAGNVTTGGNPFGTEAWVYPQMVRANEEGFEVYFPKGFNGGGMNRGNALQIKATSTIQSNEENILFADFESATWPIGWLATNNTQNIPGPIATSEITQNPTPTGYTGDRFVNTFKGDAAQLTLTSPKFTISKNYIRLYVGGGNYPDATYVGLFVNGQKVRNAYGDNGPVLRQVTWDVQALKGQEAEIRIVDASGGGWGFIMCDEIIFTDSEFGGSGYTADFRTPVAKVFDWTDLGFILRSENAAGKQMTATLVHGVPFVYVELNGLYPLLMPGAKATVYASNGNKIEQFPATVNAFTIEFDDRVFGVHAPLGSKLHQSKGGDFQIETPANKRYVVVSVLPNRSLLTTYDNYARNKPGNTQFNYEYKVSEGKIVTTFALNAVNLETGATGQSTLMSFLPHHWRTTSRNFDLIANADYQMFRGTLHTAAAASFTLSYPFGGMPPYLPEPLDMSQSQMDMLSSLLDYASEHYMVNGNTYAKGLGENSTLMLMAKNMNRPGFDLFKNNLKNEFTNWFTFTEAEKNLKDRYFAAYPNYGALIGFPPGYGSQGFNDLHFHIGYFTAGAARLMMVDKEFKRDFAEMTKLVTRTYANWDHYQTASDIYQPFLRTFDPYLGHSFAGGTGDGGGNNQESTSEAINSWFGMYLLGIELNDKAIIDAAAMGYMLEVTAAGEYWLDLYGDNFPSTYGHDYVGIVRTDNLGWATYFAGDPAWVLGIQACPVEFFFNNFGLKPEKMAAIQQSMFHDRTTFFYDGQPMHTNDDPYDNIRTMGPYLGGYHLNIMNYLNPAQSSQWIDEFCRLDGAEGQEWRNHYNTPTNYYLSRAMMTYGKPAPGYNTSIPSGAVYINDKGEITYLLYNATDAEVDVKIYYNGTILETIKVGARKYYNSRLTGVQKPTVICVSHKDNDAMAVNTDVTVKANATDKDGDILWVDFYFDGVKVGTSYKEPYEVKFRPTAAGAKELKIIATDNEGLKSDPCILTINVSATAQTPFNGTPWQIPAATIYAVQFDNGGPEVACHDNEIEMQGGDNYRPGTGVETEGTGNIANSNIGWTNTGEWFEYTVNVQTTGVYQMNARLGSAGGGALRVFFYGVDKTGSVEIASTGSWALVDNISIAKIPLKAGQQVMRVMIDRTGANLGSFKFTLLPDETMPTEVDAGQDQVIPTTQTTTTLQAVATTYGTTTVTKYEWKQIDANKPATIANPNQAQTTVSGLQQGTYVFEITATDSKGLTVSDEVAVAVIPDNFAPVADPGQTRTVPLNTTVTLDGSKSIDPDGTIVKYEWKQVDSHAALTINQTLTNPVATVASLQANKLYVFQLTVTDNQGATGSANVRIMATDGTTGFFGTETSELKLYPNPFTDRLIIDTNGSESMNRIVLYSITGQAVLEENIRGLSSIILNTSHLDKGYYILTIFSDNAVVSKKVLKK